VERSRSALGGVGSTSYRQRWGVEAARLERVSEEMMNIFKARRWL